jgi:hypothetical protein
MRLWGRNTWDYQHRLGKWLMGSLNTFQTVSDNSLQWSGNLLSCAGWEVLIKANAQAVPTLCYELFQDVGPYM